MNRNVKEIRQLISKAREDGAALVAKSETEGRAMNDTEMAELRGFETEITNLEKELEDAELREKFAKKNLAKIKDDGMDGETREMANFSITKLVREAAKGGIAKISGLERELLDESEKEARELNVTMGGSEIYLSNKVMSIQKRTNSATGTANLGGNTINTEKLGFFDQVYAKTVMAQAGATMLSGLTANTDLVGWDSTPVAYWAAENGSQSPTDATFANRSLRPKLLGSAVDISMLLNIQSNTSIDANFLASMQKVMAVAFEAAVINGDGSNKPTGILSTANIQDVAIDTAGGAPTFAKILELIQKVETANADMTACKFIINPKTKAKLKQTNVESGSGAKIMGYNNYFGTAMNVIDGYETLVTSNVPSNLEKSTSGAVLSAILFGDFSQLVMAQFGGVLMSFDNISAAMRRAGKYGITINTYVDSGIKLPATLGAIKDVVTT